MATYVYDDFRVTFTPRSDGTYSVRAVDTAGVETTGTFRPPLTDDELTRTVQGAVQYARGVARDIGGAGPPRNRPLVRHPTSTRTMEVEHLSK